MNELCRRMRSCSSMGSSAAIPASSASSSSSSASSFESVVSTIFSSSELYRTFLSGLFCNRRQSLYLSGFVGVDSGVGKIWGFDHLFISFGMSTVVFRRFVVVSAPSSSSSSSPESSTACFRLLVGVDADTVMSL